MTTTILIAYVKDCAVGLIKASHLARELTEVSIFISKSKVPEHRERDQHNCQCIGIETKDHTQNFVMRIIIAYFNNCIA